MSLSVSDLIQPKGEIEPDLFAGDAEEDATEARIEEYLALAVDVTQGITDAAAKIKAQTAYVYWRAFTAYARILRQSPADESIGPNQSRKYSEAQIKGFERDAEKYKAIFDAYIQDVAGDIISTLPTTVAVKTEFVW